MATACTNSFRHVGVSRAAERLSSSRSSYVSTAPVSVISRRRVAKKVETAITARLRPGRQGVQRIYRMATEKSQINVYEYLESIGVSADCLAAPLGALDCARSKCSESGSRVAHG